MHLERVLKYEYSSSMEYSLDLRDQNLDS